MKLGEIKLYMLRAILIILEVLLVILVLFTPPVESRAFAQAITAYHQDPSPQNELAMTQQREIVQRIRSRQGLFLFSLLIANSLGLFYVLRRPQKQTKTN